MAAEKAGDLHINMVTREEVQHIPAVIRLGTTDNNGQWENCYQGKKFRCFKMNEKLPNIWAWNVREASDVVAIHSSSLHKKVSQEDFLFFQIHLLARLIRRKEEEGP